MLKTDIELTDRLTQAYPHISPNTLCNEIYIHRIDDYIHAANERDAYRLIGFFDSFCQQIGVEYFSIAKTLVGAIVYNDVIPGTTKIEVGMLRDEYQQFEKCYIEFLHSYQMDSYSNSEANPTGFQLINLVDDSQIHRMLPLVVLCKPELVRVNDAPLYNTDHLPISSNISIEISIFDAVPDDYDLARVLFYRLKKLNRAAASSKGIRRTLIYRELWRVADSYNNKPHAQVARLMSTRSKSIPVDDIFPIRHIPFGPVEIAIPARTDTWVVEDMESQRQQVQYLQKDALAITKEIDRICRKHGIGYFVCGGTMLGLVRHGGFIPWDDDMDVGMLRCDYERFLEVAPKELADQYFLQTRESDPNIPYLFSKVRLRDSEYITRYNELRDFNKGICVDVFPFDRIPLEYGLFKEHQKKAGMLIRAHNSLANRQVPEALSAATRSRATTPMEVVGHAVMSIRHAKAWSQSLVNTQQAYDEHVTSFNDDENLHYVASFVTTFTCARLEDLLPYKDVEFEGVKLMAPAKPEVFLQMQYGDYMTEPMPHQQRGHGLLRWRGTKHSSEEFNK